MKFASRRFPWLVLLLGLTFACTTAPAAAPTAAPAAAQPTTPPAAATSAPAAAAPAPAGKRGGTLIVGLPGDLLTSEPAFSNDGNSDYVAYQVMETLVRLDPTGKQVLPGLASSWDTSADGTTYTFHLRNNVKFHDGTEFNADAVKAN